MIFAACNTENGIDAALYEALGSRLTLDDLLDILEMKAVRDSWTHAELFNGDERRAREAMAGAHPRPAFARKPKPVGRRR